jgi:hypothetical protein
MNSKLLFTVIASIAGTSLLSQTTFAQPKTEKNAVLRASAQATDSWFSNAQNFLQESSCSFKRFNNQFIAVSEQEKLGFRISGADLNIAPISGNSFNTTLKLNSISGVSSADINSPKNTITQKENYLRYDYDKYGIEYVSGKSGLRQNFIVNERPAGADNLVIRIDVIGNLRPSVLNTGALALNSNDGKKMLEYDQLNVWDADNKKLDAFMAEDGSSGFKIVVDDKNAAYPVTVDPLTHASEWQTSANGVLSSLLPQLQIDALYGFKVTGLGDVNGDGYDDVAISAPAAVDIIGANTIIGAGAVFVYFGSAAGLPTIPSRTLRSSTPVANALFGFSVAAGNVIGDSKKDIIVGSPAESYTATASGFPFSATVTAGKVYIFNGQTITGAGPYTSSSVFLDGSLYFSNGVLGLLASNVTTNALFGFSVAATEDMDGDGLGEVVIGAPGYAKAALLNVRTGAAFVYFSSDVSSNTATLLQPPAALSIPALPIINLGGLLFGFSVDGAGDYNKDTRPDIIVGAPGGLNLGVNGFLGGSAYLYTGTGSGVNTTSSTSFTAAGGLTGSIANLFGYNVKGLRGANGIRTGNLAISAPVSNVLTSVVNGLRLKSGSINIFTAKAGPAADEYPVQTLSSPRGNTGILAGILSGLNLDVSLLFGTAIDNTQDVDCDGSGDIIVGEPLSTGVGLVGVNAVGGAAYIFKGKPDGTFITTPYWTVENDVSLDAGINAGSLLGYSVAGIGQTRGAGNGFRVLVGAPGGALDFSTGALNLGNTLGTTFDFLAGNNGLGKSYTYNFSNCSVVAVRLASFNAAARSCDASLQWELATKDGLKTTEIEQSPDGSHFTRISTIENTNGTSMNYQVNMSQKNMIAYYRLKFIQADGTVFYSDVRKVRTSCGNANVLQAYPTLFTNDVKVIYTASAARGNAVITLTDVYGRKIFTRNINVVAGDNQSVINGATLSPGVYYVQLIGDNYRSETVKIIKQ